MSTTAYMGMVFAAHDIRTDHPEHIADDLYDEDCRACRDERNAVIAAAREIRRHHD